MSLDVKAIAEHVQRATAQLAAFRVLEVVPSVTISTVSSGYVVRLLGVEATDRDLGTAIVKAATLAGVEIPRQPNTVKISNRPPAALKGNS